MPVLTGIYPIGYRLEWVTAGCIAVSSHGGAGDVPRRRTGRVGRPPGDDRRALRSRRARAGRVRRLVDPVRRQHPSRRARRRASEVPTDREVVTVCASGSRSSSAAEILSRTGRQVANLVGGMAGWATTYDAVTLELDDVRVVQVRRRGKGCLSYLVGAGDQAFVVDPSFDIEVYARLADEHGWRITRVFDTHLHADHLSGARLLAEDDRRGPPSEPGRSVRVRLRAPRRRGPTSSSPAASPSTWPPSTPPGTPEVRRSTSSPTVSSVG